MKRFLFSLTLLLLTSTVFSQVIFDLGLKAGVHTSNMDIKSITEIESDAITKMHIGAFGRVGYGRLFVQPEVYFSQKGGDLSSNLIKESGDFDYKNIDVPLLFGFKIIKGKVLDFHLLAGPTFSFLVDDPNYPHELDPFLDVDFFNKNMYGVQYGLGVDVLFLTIDARVEHASKIYDSTGDTGAIPISGKTTTFMFTVGFKIL